MPITGAVRSVALTPGAATVLAACASSGSPSAHRSASSAAEPCIGRRPRVERRGDRALGHPAHPHRQPGHAQPSARQVRSGSPTSTATSSNAWTRLPAGRRPRSPPPRPVRDGLWRRSIWVRTTPHQRSPRSTSAPPRPRPSPSAPSPYDVTFAGGQCMGHRLRRRHRHPDRAEPTNPPRSRSVPTRSGSPTPPAPSGRGLRQQRAVQDRHHDRQGHHSALRRLTELDRLRREHRLDRRPRCWPDRQTDARTATIVRRTKVGPTPNDGDVFDGAVWFPDKTGSLYRLDQRTDAVTGPFALAAGNPFVVSGYANRLWIADFGGTDTIARRPRPPVAPLGDLPAARCCHQHRARRPWRCRYRRGAADGLVSQDRRTDGPRPCHGTPWTPRLPA